MPILNLCLSLSEGLLIGSEASCDHAVAMVETGVVPPLICLTQSPFVHPINVFICHFLNCCLLLNFSLKVLLKEWEVLAIVSSRKSILLDSSHVSRHIRQTLGCLTHGCLDLSLGVFFHTVDIIDTFGASFAF